MAHFFLCLGREYIPDNDFGRITCSRDLSCAPLHLDLLRHVVKLDSQPPTPIPN